VDEVEEVIAGGTAARPVLSLPVVILSNCRRAVSYLTWGSAPYKPSATLTASTFLTFNPLTISPMQREALLSKAAAFNTQPDI
jgi:hypothetical protein